MRVWTCDDFTGHYPVGTAAVVAADTEDEARTLLRSELQARGLGTDDFTLVPVPAIPTARILCDGNY